MNSFINKHLYLSLLVFILFKCYHSFPDVGKWSFTVTEKRCHYFHVHNALYKDSIVSIKVSCDNGYESPSDMKIRIGWVMRETQCFEEYLGPEVAMPDFLKQYYFCPGALWADFGYNRVRYLKRREIEVKCNHVINLVPRKEEFRIDLIGLNETQSVKCMPPKDLVCDSSPPSPLATLFTSDTVSLSKMSDSSNNLQMGMNMRRKRAAVSDTITNKTNSIKLDDDALITIPSDGVYLLVLFMSVAPDYRFNSTVDIEMKSESGYLSAVDWPLLPFYGFMCIIYVIYAIGWLIVTFIQWRDLLRIQFWIGSVIFIGLIEKAVFYAEYQSINTTGQSVRGGVLSAEILSCLKRTVARMLVIIVSYGFGIVKPRLGPMLQRIICAGGLYFILSSTEAVLRIYRAKNDPTNQTFLAGIPLALLDSIICWWVFSSLVSTMRTLRLRRNLVKLTIYKQFTNTLIFAVLASVAFMVWVIHDHRLTQCLTDWKQLWIDEAFWHMLFSVVLLVIMVLWRPTNNNQRYAFTPLLDASDDEDEEPQGPYEAFDGMTLRQQRNSVNDTNAHKNNFNHHTKESVISKETEENLKWIEENIPTSLVDAALPALIDSDEEIMTTKFERNKME